MLLTRIACPLVIYSSDEANVVRCLVKRLLVVNCGRMGAHGRGKGKRSRASDLGNALFMHSLANVLTRRIPSAVSYHVLLNINNSFRASFDLF